MGAVKKYNKIYAKDEQESASKDKQQIEAYKKKIEQMMQDPKMQKKAALILENLIKSGSKK